jgi:hypothetical protein
MNRSLPLEDSLDFTENDVLAADVIDAPLELTARIVHLCCASCGKPLGAKEHALKRFHGFHYSRITFVCENDHTETRVFRFDWLKVPG